MQCRVNDVTVDKMPKFLAPQLTDQTHALTLTYPEDPLLLVILPLELMGVISLLYVRNVDSDDFHSGRYPRLHLTSETLTWDPQTNLYKEQERAMTDISGAIVHDAAVRGPSLVIIELHSFATNTADVMHDCNFH
jgi:hypothetical protein